MPSSVVKYEPFTTVFLFGGTPLMSSLAEALKDQYSVCMYTAPRQAGDIKEVYGVPLYVTNDINAALADVPIGNALGIGIGEAWQFGPDLRKAFGNRLVDFMSIPYPNYLGGAHVSHAILRNETSWGCCMQLVTENTLQGEVHDGAVIDAKNMIFPDSDHHRRLEQEYLAYLVRFVARAAEGEEFSSAVGTYHYTFYPRLNTAVQSWIDWNWRRGEIIRFIKAFDHPYPGARTRLTDESAGFITLHDPTEGHNDGLWHPFHFGLVISSEGARIQVQCLGGRLFATARDEHGMLIDLKPGTRLLTTTDDRERAMCYVPQYTTTGDARAV